MDTQIGPGHPVNVFQGLKEQAYFMTHDPMNERRDTGNVESKSMVLSTPPEELTNTRRKSMAIKEMFDAEELQELENARRRKAKHEERKARKHWRKTKNADSPQNTESGVRKPSRTKRDQSQTSLDNNQNRYKHRGSDEDVGK